MDNRAEIRDFLSSRRARMTPEQAGLPVYGGHRRVPGLRREEAAMLAGVSVDYYNRLERGELGGASETVLESLARGLQLDEAERAHLFDLARTAGTGAATRRRPATQRVRPTLQRLLDAITEAPAYARNDRMDLLATNRRARALLAPVLDSRYGPANTARFMFLDPRSADYYVDWEKSANDSVAVLRGAAGRDPFDRALSDLIGELSTRSEDFRSRWAAHDVRFHRTGFKRLRHPVVGDLELAFEALEVPADPGLTLIVYSAEPNSPSADGLSLLASWTDTLQASPAGDTTTVIHP